MWGWRPVGVGFGIDLRDRNALAVTSGCRASVVHHGVVGDDKVKAGTGVRVSFEGNRSSTASHLVVVDEVLDERGPASVFEVDGSSAAAGRRVVADHVVFDEGATPQTAIPAPPFPPAISNPDSTLFSMVLPRIKGEFVLLGAAYPLRSPPI